MANLYSEGMNLLPVGTTWLDIATLGIALGGFLIAVVSLMLAFSRHRRETSVAVRVESGVVMAGNDGVIAVILTKTEFRTLTVSRVGIACRRDVSGLTFECWHSVNVRRREAGFPLGDAPLPKALEPGSAPYGVLAGVRSIKSAFHPIVPMWAFCVDTYRNVYWGPLPEDVQAAIRKTKRRVAGPDDDYGQPTAVEIPDDAEVEQSALYDYRGGQGS
jgi:hypothetical protein